MLDEPSYMKLADVTLRAIEDGFNDIDAEVVDLERAGDVITLTFASGTKCVINTQRPSRQIWVAANARGWHFTYDAATARWVDERGTGDELFGTVERIVAESSGAAVRFALPG